MRKFTTFVFLLLAVVLHAQQITPDEAAAIASEFLNSSSTPLKGATRVKAKRVMPKAEASDSDAKPYYVFNGDKDQGFVIISGDKRAKKVIGYSDKGNFDYDNLPPQLSAMLDQFARQVEALPASAAPDPSWDKASRTSSNDEGILLETANWGQGYPYNLQTPIIDGEHCLTGCVATAMAIVMKYHNWPPHTYGNQVTNFYHDNITVDFNNSVINWANIDENSENFKDEVSNLMLLTGTSVHTHYETQESGASMHAICHELISTFGYDANCCYLTRKFYDDEEWRKLIDRQINSGLPIIYGSTIENSWQGHTYVLDGKAGDLYHINWGWNGNFNGYFDLDFLKPDTDNFSGHQSMIINIKPDLDPAPQLYSPLQVVYGWNTTFRTGQINSNTSEIKKNELVTFTGPVVSFPAEFHGVVNYALIDENDNILEFAKPFYFSESNKDKVSTLTSEDFYQSVSEGWRLDNTMSAAWFPIEANSLSEFCRTFAFTETEVLPSYRVVLMTKEDSDNDWKQVLGLNGMLNYVPVTGINSQWADVEWIYDSELLGIKHFDPRIVGESLTRVLRYQNYKNFNLIYKSGNSKVFINDVIIDNQDYSDDYLGEFYENIENEFPRLMFPSDLPEYKIKIEYTPDPEVGCLAAIIRLDHDFVTMKVRESITLAAEIMPKATTNKNLNWSSSDPSVLTVDEEGKVTAIATGSATITATATDGSDVSAVCHVTVDPPVIAESVTIEPKEWSGYEGESFTITATVLPENTTDPTLSWSSSDQTVATVDNEGNVTAIAIGEADITVTATDGSDVSAVCHVTVLPILAESVTIEPKEWSGYEGESFTITATVLPENTTDPTLSWSSSDQTVATVDNEGKVTAIAIGEADITVTATDGSDVSAVCHVAVLPILAESITLEPKEWSGYEGESFTITATVLPENTTDPTLSWISSDQTVATVDNEGKVSVLKPGNCVITASTTDGSDLSADCIITSSSGINAIFNDDNGLWDVYNVAGTLIIKEGNPEQLRQLQSGIYIFRQGSRSIKIFIK